MALNENIMIRLSADTSNYSTRMAAASTQAEKLSTALEKPGSKSRIATNLMAGMGLAAIALGVSATKLAADFDQSMSTIQADLQASDGDMQKLRAAAIQAGARRAYLIEEPVAAAIGAGIDIAKPDGHMIVDIGGGTTDIAVISLSGIVESTSIKIAGDQFDEAIVKYIRRKHNVLIGERTAEELKMQIGCVFPRPEEQTVEIKGRCLMTGLPRVFSVSSSEMIEAFEEVSTRILEAIHGVLERTPPELVADISTNGICMTGGGSLVWGFDKLIESHTGIETHVADDAISCVAYGTGKSLDDVDSMQDGTINLSRRKQMN